MAAFDPERSFVPEAIARGWPIAERRLRGAQQQQANRPCAGMDGQRRPTNSPRRNSSVSPSWRRLLSTRIEWWQLMIEPPCDPLPGGASDKSRPMIAVFSRVPNTGTTLLDNWFWGLSLIALTIGIHATGVTFMVWVLHSIRVRLEN